MKLRLRIFAVLLVLAMVFAFAVGCSDTERLDELQNRIDALEQSLAAKEAAINSLVDELAGLNGQVELYQTVADTLLTNNLSANLETLQALSNTVAQTFEDGKIVVLHTNDTHGRDVMSEDSFGRASLLALRRIYENQGYKVILVDAGDAVQGVPLVNYSQGESAIDFMNIAKYDLAIPGNHELDWGFENFTDLVDKANFEYICANMVYSTTNTPAGKTAGDLVLPANKVFWVDGVKIGFFGLATPETATKAHPDKVSGIEFLAGEDLYDCAQDQVDELRDAGCDIVIAIGHLGTSNESEDNRSTDVIAEVSGIDVFIDGHSHDLYENEEVEDKDGNTTILASTGELFKNIGTIGFDDKNAPVSYIFANRANDNGAYGYAATNIGAGTRLLTSMLFPDAVRTINNANELVEEQLSAVFAVTEVQLNGARPAIRNQETNLGNFAADALLWQAKESLGAANVDAALTNGGGIRASIGSSETSAQKPYSITLKDMVTVFPFGNTVAVVTITGEQLWEALEAATYNIDGTSDTSIGAFPQIAGIEFTLDTTKEWVKGTQYTGSTYFAPGYTNGIENQNKRVTIQTVGGVEFSKTATYKIATNDFTAAGGDTYSVLKLCSAFVNLGIAMDDALINFVNDTNNFSKNTDGLPVITSALYGPSTVGSRITIIKASA